jgi:hypothetical protein
MARLMVGCGSPSKSAYPRPRISGIVRIYETQPEGAGGHRSAYGDGTAGTFDGTQPSKDNQNSSAASERSTRSGGRCAVLESDREPERDFADAARVRAGPRDVSGCRGMDAVRSEVPARSISLSRLRKRRDPRRCMWRARRARAHLTRCKPHWQQNSRWRY